MLIVKQFQTEPHECAYLPGQEAVLEYSLAPVLSAEEYEGLMDRGCRKFGAAYFRPVCPRCTACRPIRIPVEEFRPDRSQRRALARNRDLEVRWGQPVVDPARLGLYHRYHQAQTERKGWPEKEKDVREYALTFLRNPVPCVEITLWAGEELLAVTLTEVTPNVVSGIYHYWEPTQAERGLGTVCMLQVIQLAARLGKRWAYFGYYVSGCPSLEYKARFRPCEIMGEDGVWRPFASRA